MRAKTSPIPNRHQLPHPLLNEEEAAHVLGVSPKTLQRWRVFKRGVRYIKVGAAVRYDLTDLTDYINAQRVVP
jgi:hypothetical protein